MLITSPIPNLIGGISQQPPSIRDINEAQDILNAVPSPTEGLIKRPPTEFLARLDIGGTVHIAAPTNPPFMHMIERDENERYILSIMANGDVSVHDLAGVKKTVHTSTGFSLGTVTSPSQRRALTVGDVTFIANTGTSVLTTANLSPQSPANYNRSGLIWIKQANYNRAHTVKIFQGANTYTFTHISRSVQVTSGGSSGVNDTYNVTLTYVLGTKAAIYPKARIVVSGGSVTSVKITEDGVDWESELIDTELAAAGTAGIPSGFRVKIKSLFDGEIGTEKVALSLALGQTSSYIGPVGGIAGLSGFSNTVAVDGVIRLSATSDFSVQVEDDFAGEGIGFIRDSAQRFEDLPPGAPADYTVKIAGVPETRTDDYYVKFVPTTGSNRGLWTETIKPGIKDELDPATMPKILVRQADGTFMLKQADGAVPSSNVPVGMIGVYEALKWDKRLVGDDDTNPMPSFVLGKIQDIVYYQNRLGFSSGENLILSETGESFNFFRTTVIDLLDSDPIDVASSAPKVSKITSIVPFNRDLILFSPANQMIMRGPAVLTPTTVSISPVGDYDNLSSVFKPVPSANSIFFAYKNGNFCGVREMVPNEMLDGSYVANELTGNVPRLIPSDLKAVATTTHENIVAVAAGGDLYCYRYFNAPDRRIQSAWFRFQFPDSNGTQNAKPIWCHFVESDLYIGMLRYLSAPNNHYITIEKMKMGAKATDADITGSEWATHVDLRSYLAAGAGVYNSATNTTTFTLPHPLNYVAGKTVAILPNGYILKDTGGTSYTGLLSNQNGTIQVQGDYSAENVFVGLLYPMVFEMSQFYLKGPAGQGEAAMLNGRCQLKNLVLQYAETGYFRVEVEIDNGPTYIYVFTGETVGLAITGAPNILTGSIRIPVASRNTQAKILIKNDSPLPSKILSGEYEVMYSDRAVRYMR